MSIIDTSLLIDRVSEGKVINENICFLSVIEYPMILEYKQFRGKIYSPDEKDLKSALDMQDWLG